MGFLLLLSLLLPAQGKNQAVPEGAALRDAEKLVREVFKEDYSKKSPADRTVLARKLLRQGIESKGDPVPQFVLFSEARDLAAQVGDLDTALAAIAELAKIFQVDANAMKDAAVAAVAKSAKTPEDFLRIARVFLSMAEDAATELKFDVAEKAAEQAGQYARKSKDVALVSSAAARAREYGANRTKLEKAERAREALRKNPDDPEANLALGQYLCFVKGDWDAGLGHLAKGSDAGLKGVATREAARPTDAAEQVAAGDAWWELGEKDALMRAASRQRAVYWYGMAKDRLAGLTRARIEKRMEAPGPLPAAVIDLDLLSRVDPAMDSVQGDWKMVDGKLISPVFLQPKFASCALPYAPPEEYDLTIVAERRSGKSSLAVGLVAGGKQFDLELDGFDGIAQKSFSGLDRIDGVWPPKAEVAFRGGIFADRAPHKVVVKVRKAGVTVLLDGQQVLSWAADYRRVSAPHPAITVRTPDSLFLAAWQSEYAIQQLTVKPVSGQGRLLR